MSPRQRKFEAYLSCLDMRSAVFWTWPMLVRMKRIAYLPGVPANGLLTPRAQILVLLAADPTMRLRTLADEIGMSLRGVQELVGGLVAEGLLERSRDGRRNRYVVRGERSLPDAVSPNVPISDLLDVLVRKRNLRPDTRRATALVLACSDRGYQEPLRALLASEGLIGLADILLWPGGSSALGGPEAWAIVGAMERYMRRRPPLRRVLLVAHQGCRMPGAYTSSRRDPVATAQAVGNRRRRGADLVSRVLGIEPELWFLTERGAQRPHAGRSHRTERAPLIEALPS